MKQEREMFPRGDTSTVQKLVSKTTV